MRFISPNALVVYQVVQKAVARLQKRGQGGSFTLKAVFLNPQDGSVIRRMQWSSSAWLHDDTLIYTTDDGHFLVRTGRTLRAYSPDYREKASFTLLRLPGQCLTDWITQVVSPGRLFFAGLTPCEGPDKTILFNSENLDPVANPSAADLAF